MTTAKRPAAGGDPPDRAGRPDPSDPGGSSEIRDLGDGADPATMPYADALAELESILAELERDDVDVDHLAAHVARAAALIEACRQRIDTARVDVERIVGSLGG
jgi:exodeoxyribonuclease VII small subunit